MLSALEKLSRTLVANFAIATFNGHKEYGETETCPGTNLLPAVQALRTKLNLSAPMFRKLWCADSPPACCCYPSCSGRGGCSPASFTGSTRP